MPQTEGTDLRWPIIHLVILSLSVLEDTHDRFLTSVGAEKVLSGCLLN